MLPFNMGAGGASGAYTGDIPASLRFRSGAGAYLSRTFGTPTAQNTWTLSFWVKQAGSISTAAAGGVFIRKVDTQNFESIAFDPNAGADTNKLGSFTRTTSGTNNRRASSDAVYRDPTAWHNVVVAKSVSQSSSAPTFYVNGVSISVPTRSSAGTPQDFINSAAAHIIGQDAQSTTTSDFYLARICFIDGSALTPSSFGYLNTEINEWVSKSQSAVKAVVDAGGTNSFMLDFDDATSLTTLGYDKSSKGNNWTLNNFSLTAGTTYDHMLDVPGNSYATINTINPTAASTTKTNGNLTWSSTSANHTTYTASTISTESGKWYAECTITNHGNTWPTVGVMKTVREVGGAATYLYSYSDGYAYISTGNKGNNGSSSAYGATYTTGDVIGIALDIDAGTLTFYKNGASQGVAYSSLTGPFVFAASGIWTTSNAPVQDWNFGQAPLHASATYDSASGGYFRYTPPSGYKALCQRNMPDPAILNPELHMDVVTRTGTAATYSVAGLGFQPDLVWVKSRGRAVDHALYDSVRGVQKQLESNQTGVETTESTGLTAFNSGGYTGGALDQINGTTATNSFVDWLWKAGGAAVTNNAGSISSQVSANVTAGFSIVTYTGTGANATVGHGLGKAPGLVIVKNRQTAGASWNVWHSLLAGTEYLLLDSTAAKATDATRWNSTSPTSTVFSLGSSTGPNENTKNHVAYCFAEISGFSKIFSYTGNGSADGPFVHCGFKPKFVLIKRVDAAATWCVIDGVRNPSNVENLRLYPSAATAEETNTYLDATSNGFKVRVDSAEPTMNASGGTYIGIAFADVPAKYSLAR